MSRALHAEWTKLRTAGSTGWLLLAVVVLTAAVGAATAGSVTCHTAGGCGQDPTRLSLTGIYLGQAVAAIIAVLAIGGEYSTGMIRLTFTAMPRRICLLAAKSAVVTGLVLAAGTIASAASVLAGQIILPGHGCGIHVVRVAARPPRLGRDPQIAGIGALAAVRPVGRGPVGCLLVRIPVRLAWPDPIWPTGPARDDGRFAVAAGQSCGQGIAACRAPRCSAGS